MCLFKHLKYLFIIPSYYSEQAWILNGVKKSFKKEIKSLAKGFLKGFK